MMNNKPTSQLDLSSFDLEIHCEEVFDEAIPVEFTIDYLCDLTPE